MLFLNYELFYSVLCALVVVTTLLVYLMIRYAALKRENEIIRHCSKHQLLQDIINKHNED